MPIDYGNYDFSSKSFIDLRKNHLKMTQKELAENLGCSVETIKKWEGHKTQPTGKYIYQILKLASKIGLALEKIPELFKKHS